MAKTQNHKHHRSGGGSFSGPHKGRKTAGKRRLNFGGGRGGIRGGEGRGGGRKTFGAKTEKENGAAAYKAGYRKAGKQTMPSTPKPFMLDGDVVSKLDQSDPVQARRIQQRRRMVEKGKNTVGYEQYCKQVPREKRRPRSLEHPSTPPYDADIPNRRWQGMVKAWRIVLHRYDPPDLKNSDADKPQDPLVAAMASSFASSAAVDDSKVQKPACKGVQAQQIAEAASSGMLVDFGSADDNGGCGTSEIAVGASSNMQEHEENMYQEMIQQAEEENTDDILGFGGGKTNGTLDDEDSDDDLL